MADKVKVIQIDTGSAQRSVKDLRNELKSLRDTLLNVDQGTVEYSQALQQAANIQNELREQTQMINASAMDFGQIIGNVTTTVGGLMSGMQAALAVMNLFGIENKEVMESLKQMQNIMALTQGIAGMENGIKSLGRLVNALKASTVAAKLFHAALTPKGLLAIAAAIGAITAAIALLKKQFGDKNKLELSVSQNTDLKEKTWSPLSTVDSKLQELLKTLTVPEGLEVTYNEYLEYWKKTGETELQLLERRRNLIIDYLNKLDSNENELRNLYDKLEKDFEKYNPTQRQKGVLRIKQTQGDFFRITERRYQKELYDFYFDYFMNNNQELAARKVQAAFGNHTLSYNIIYRLLTDKEVDVSKKYDDYADFYNQVKDRRESDTQKQMDEINETLLESVSHYIEIEKINEQIKDDTEKIKKLDKEREENAKKYQENLKSAKKSYSDLIKEIETFGLSGEELDILGVNRLFGNKDSGFTEDGQYVSTLREARRYRIISEEELTKQLELLEEEREKRIAEIRKKYREAEEEDRETRLQSALDQIQREIDKKIANINHEYELYNQAVYQDQLEIEEEIASGFFKTTDDMQKQLNDLDEEMIQSNIERLEKILEIEHLSEYERIQIQNDIYDNQIRLYELQDQHHAAMVQREIARYSTLGYSVGEIFSNLGTLMEEGSEEAKAFQIMGATINMLAGITAAISGAFTTHSGIWDVAIAAAQAAAIASSGAATIAQIARTTKDNASSVGMSAASTALTLVAPVQYTQDVQGAELERQIAQQKVYVLESDITTSQKKVSVVESEAKF